MKITERRLRSGRWLSGHGIEIGALGDPLLLPDDVHVSYVDRLPVDGLRRQHPELAGETLVAVDIIGHAEDLSSIADESQDFVIADHPLDELDSPLAALVEMARVLRPGGVLHVAFPESPDGPHSTREAAHTASLRGWQPGDFLEVISAARREAGVALDLLEFSACQPGLDDESIFVVAKGGRAPASPRDDPTRAELDHLRAEVG